MISESDKEDLKKEMRRLEKAVLPLFDAFKQRTGFDVTGVDVVVCLEKTNCGEVRHTDLRVNIAP